MKTLFKKFMEFFRVYKTTYFFIIVFAFMVFTLIAFDVVWVNGGLSNSGFQENLLVEAHGVLGDILIFGIILSVYDTYKKIKTDKENAENERKNKISRLYEEISDFKGWDEIEASYRITGIVKRLQKLGVTKFNLDDCFIENSNFGDWTFTNSSFKQTNFKNVDFGFVTLIDCEFIDADLSYSSFSDYYSRYSLSPIIDNCSFKKCNMSYCFMIDIDISSITLEECELDMLLLDDIEFTNKLQLDSKNYVETKYELLSSKEYNYTNPQFLGYDIYDKIVKDFNKKMKTLIDKKVEFFFFVNKDRVKDYKKEFRRMHSSS